MALTDSCNTLMKTKKYKVISRDQQNAQLERPQFLQIPCLEINLNSQSSLGLARKASFKNLCYLGQATSLVCIIALLNDAA